MAVTFTFSYLAQQPPVGQSLLILDEVSRSHTKTHPRSVGLLWTSDQLVAETSTSQLTTLTTDRHPCPDGIRTRDLSKRAAADLRVRPRDHWDRLCYTHIHSQILNGIALRYSVTIFYPNWSRNTKSQTEINLRP